MTPVHSANEVAAPVDGRLIEVKPQGQGGLEVSFVMPCLNEAATIESCVRAARKCIESNSLAGEVVVGDNGSTDGSQDLARAAGARVVPIPMRGYGAAVMGAIDAAKGRFIILGDSDGQHDFAECMPLVQKLREGVDLVMGTRMKGTILPGAMSWKSRYIGNPILTATGRVLFKAPFSDFHCGLRGFTKASYLTLGVKTTGFEFTTEHIVKYTCRQLKLAEVPISVHPAGRDRPPHLRHWQDGWRTLRFMLLLSPRWTLFQPGIALLALGLVLGAVALLGVKVGPGALGPHALIGAGLLVMVGYQCILTAMAMRIFAVEGEIGPPSPKLQRLHKVFTLERGLIAGAIACVLGAALMAVPIYKWVSSGYAMLDKSVTLPPTIVGAVAVALGVQTILMSFMYSMLGIKHKQG